MKKRTIYIVLGVGIVGIIILSLISSGRKKKELATIRKSLREGIGASGQENVTDILRNVKENPAYEPEAKKIAKIIKGAHVGWYWDDDEDAVYNALAGKTKSQIKTIEEVFKNTYGMTLHEWLKEWMGESEYQKVINIIKSAKG